MNGHLRRLPNNCGFIEKYNGTLLGFKCILYMIASVFNNNEICTTRIFKYKEFGFNSAFLHQGRKFICKTIVDSVYMNENWLSEYINVHFDDKNVYVDYTDKMIQVCQTNATNYYLFDMDTVISFNNVGAIKLYLIYRRNLFIHQYKGDNSFSCNNETFCNIFPNYTSYRILRHAVNVAINDFNKTLGYVVQIKKSNDVWKIIYDDMTEQERQELEEALALDDEDDI